MKRWNECQTNVIFRITAHERILWPLIKQLKILSVAIIYETMALLLNGLSTYLKTMLYKKMVILSHKDNSHRKWH